MTRRRGFTVLELLVALTLTAVALTLTGTALSAARSTEAAIARSRAIALPTAQARQLLIDLLRHLPRVDEVDAPLLTLTNGSPAPTLTFLSRGLDSPFGTGAIWVIRLSQPGDSLLLEATPLRPAPHLRARRILIPATAPLAIDALVAGPDGRLERRTEWLAAVQHPAALSIRWELVASEGTGRELLVPLDPLGRQP